jgi:hypothetical protein
MRTLAMPSKEELPPYEALDPDYRASEAEGVTSGSRGPQTKAEAEAAEKRRRETFSEVELAEAKLRDAMVREQTGRDDLNLGAREEDE